MEKDSRTCKGAVLWLQPIIKSSGPVGGAIGGCVSC